MLDLGKNLDKFSSKFLSRRKVFVMDLFISFVISVVVALLAFLLNEDIVLIRSFDLVWGISALVGSALMFWLFKTNVIIIRHFSADLKHHALVTMYHVAMLHITNRHQIDLLYYNI